MKIPHVLRRRALQDDLIARLLAHSLASEAHAKPSQVHEADRDYIDTEGRIALDLPLSSELHADISTLALAWLPDVSEALGVRPFDPVLDITLAAHGDGAFYKRHIDTFTGAAAAGEAPRQVTFVCYFFREPKAFTGGALRLFDLHEESFVDIEPENGLMLAFPSWSAHEVRPVSCASGRFADYRFAVNIWACGWRRQPAART